MFYLWLLCCRSYSRTPDRSDDSSRKSREREASKEKINKYSEGAVPAEPPAPPAEENQTASRQDAPVSDGEDRDDYNGEAKKDD